MRSGGRREECLLSDSPSGSEFRKKGKQNVIRKGLNKGHRDAGAGKHTLLLGVVILVACISGMAFDGIRGIPPQSAHISDGMGKK